MDKTKQMTVCEVVHKLIGPVVAVGDSSQDEKRLENLREMIELAEYTIHRIGLAANNKYRPEASMKKSGEVAAKFLETLRNEHSN